MYEHTSATVIINMYSEQERISTCVNLHTIIHKCVNVWQQRDGTCTQRKEK